MFVWFGILCSILLLNLCYHILWQTSSYSCFSSESKNCSLNATVVPVLLYSLAELTMLVQELVPHLLDFLAGSTNSAQV